MLLRAIDSVKHGPEMLSSTSAAFNNPKSPQKQLIYGASRVAIFSLSCCSWAVLHHTNPQTLGNRKVGDKTQSGRKLLFSHNITLLFQIRGKDFRSNFSSLMLGSQNVWRNIFKSTSGRKNGPILLQVEQFSKFLDTIPFIEGNASMQEHSNYPVKKDLNNAELNIHTDFTECCCSELNNSLCQGTSSWLSYLQQRQSTWQRTSPLQSSSGRKAANHSSSEWGPPACPLGVWGSG